MSVPGTARLIAASGFGEPRFGEASRESPRGPPLRDGGFGAQTLPSPTFADEPSTLAGLTSRRAHRTRPPPGRPSCRARRHSRQRGGGPTVVAVR
jgi:hypothetical protein